ncbi:unnamed protein product [Linum tenue]|jgi:hypothetical protein
MHF